MTSGPDRDLLALASRQGGVVGFEQAVGAGLSQAGVTRRLGSREWERVQPRAYRLVALPADRLGGMWAAILSAPVAVVSGRSAAWCHGLLDELPPAAEVVLPRACSRRLVGVRSTRSDLHRRDRTVRRRLPVVGCALAVLQCLSVAGRDGPELLDRAFQQGLGYGELAAALERWRGRRGVAAVDTLMAAAADGAASTSERVAHDLLRAAGIGGWRPNHPVGRAMVDIAFPEQKVAVEVDGWAWHHTRDRFERDRVRQNVLVLAGWTVLRFTWADLARDPTRVVAVVRRAVDR